MTKSMMPEQWYGYNRLVEDYGQTIYSKISPETLEEYSLLLPEYLLEIWRTIGLTCHARGYICFIDPGEYEDTIHQSIGSHTGLVPFARDSLGYIFCFCKGKIYRVDLFEREASLITDMALDDFLIYGIILEQSPEYKQHLKLLKRLGEVNSNQIYAYLPIGYSDDKNLKSKANIVGLQDFARQLTDFLKSGHSADQQAT